MAIAFVNSFFSGGATTGTSATVGTFAITLHNLVVVIIACKPTSVTVSSVSDGTNTYVSAGVNSVNSANYRTEVFYKANAAAVASATVTVTMNGTVSDLNIATLQYSGAALSNPFDLAVVGTGTSGTPWTSPSFTPAASGETAIIFGIAATPWTPGAGTNYTLRDSGIGSGATLGGADRINAPAGAQTASVTSDFSRTWQVVVAVFSPTDITSGITPEDFEQHTLGRSFAIPYTLAAHAAVFAPSLTPALATAVPANSKPRATVLPDFFMRPIWNPDRTDVTRAGWTQATWAIPPTWKPAPTLPEVYLRPKWEPERTETARAGWTQSLWAVAPTKIPEPVLPERRLTQWNPERSVTERPASVQATWAVPPTKIPDPLQPESLTRPAWNPERTHSVGIPYLPPTWPTTVVQPERNLRPPWNPERSDNARAGWTQALWAIAPTRPPDGVSPERLLTPWRPQDQQPIWNPFQFAAVLVPTWGYETLGTQNVAIGWNPPHGDLFISGFRAQVPVFGYEVYGPQRLLLNWKPERSELTRAGWIQSLWAVPPADWEPLLPDQPYPLIAPDRSMLCVPIQVTRAPSSTVYAIFVFDD